jgi:hypothetical protein
MRLDQEQGDKDRDQKAGGRDYVKYTSYIKKQSSNDVEEKRKDRTI